MGERNIVLFRKLRLKRYIWLYRRSLRKKIAICSNERKPIKLNIGSSTIHYDSWISLDLPFFDLRKKKDFEYLFIQKSIDNILMEHVLEHLSEAEVRFALSNIKNYMKPLVGIVRIAVPDKNHPDPKYIEYVRPNGSGPGADDHKSFWNSETLCALALELGYTPKLLEYYDGSGKLHMDEINENEGTIRRTMRKLEHIIIPNYSSLIIDLKVQ